MEELSWCGSWDKWGPGGRKKAKIDLERVMLTRMMNQTENRQDPRLTLRLPVRCESVAVPGYRTLGLTSNVSRNGLLVEVPQLVPRGTPTNLRVLTGDRIACAEAVVVWTAENSSSRMGLKLTGMAEADSLAWEDLLDFQGGPTPRTSLRVSIDLEVTCLIPPDTSLPGRIENVSEGGLMVVLPRAMPPGTRFGVAGPAWLLQTPVEAEVVWTSAWAERDRVPHGLRVLAKEKGKELFRISTIHRILLG